MQSRTPKATLGVKLPSPAGLLKVGCAWWGGSVPIIGAVPQAETVLGTPGMSRGSVCSRDLERWGEEGALVSLVVT